MTIHSKRFSKLLSDTNLFTYFSYKNITSTWHSFLPNILGIQIDHVLFSKNFNLVNKTVSKNMSSDHRPLIVELSF